MMIDSMKNYKLGQMIKYCEICELSGDNDYHFNFFYMKTTFHKKINNSVYIHVFDHYYRDIYVIFYEKMFLLIWIKFISHIYNILPFH